MMRKIKKCNIADETIMMTKRRRERNAFTRKIKSIANEMKIKLTSFFFFLSLS